MPEVEQAASAPAAPAPPQPDNEVKSPVTFHELRDPIQAYAKTVKIIGFRKPSAKDIVRYGNPVKSLPLGDPKDITFDAPKMNAMLAALSNVPPESIESMDPNDWVECGWAVAPFFIPYMRRGGAAPQT